MPPRPIHLSPRHDHDEGPPSPTEYILLLLILLAAAVAFLVFRRQRSSQGFALAELRHGVRLSDDEGPSPESFLTNNASSDSLPQHIEADVPVLPQRAVDEAAALANNIAHRRSGSNGNESRSPSTGLGRGLNPASHHNQTVGDDGAAKRLAANASLIASLNPASHHTATAADAHPALSTRTPSPATSGTGTESGADPLGADAGGDMPLRTQKADAQPRRYMRRSARRGPVEPSDSEDSGSRGSPNRVFTLDDEEDDDD